jgi:MFS family permease
MYLFARRTTRPLPHPSALVRYLVTAALARAASGGSAFGLIAVAISVSERHGGGVATGGLLAALLTAPHLLAPILARLSNGVRDDRQILAGAFVVFGIGLAATAVLVGRVPLAVTAGFAVLAGLCGPLMTGGLSARLSVLVDSDQRSQRRAEAWDSATYGLGATLGPTLVACVAATSGAISAVLALSALSVAGAVGVLALPGRERTAPRAPDSRKHHAIRPILDGGPLRRVMMVTMLTALGTGGLPVTAAALGNQLRHGAGSGAALGAAYGLGNLAGSLAVTAFPLRGEPEITTIRMVGFSAALIGFCSLAPNYLTAVATFAAAGAAGALLFTASLAVRSMYSPPEARSQVFVTMAGLKVATASAGTALTGVLIGHGARLLLAVGAAVVAIAALVALLDRIHSRYRLQQSRFNS